MSLTAHRILQYIALILIFTAMAGGYWYWKSQAAVRINQGLEDSLEQGLVGYWKLDDASGTTATDSSGNGNNGTLTNGPTWGAGQVNGGVVFDGVDDRINSVSNSPQIASLTKATVSFWVNPTQIGGIFNTLSDDFGGNGPFSNGFEITKDSGHGTQTIRLAVDGSTGDMMAHSTAVLPLSTWTHVVVVWDGSLTSTGTKFYYNGGIAGTTAQENGSGVYVPSDGRFKMGVFTGGNSPLGGSLDEVRVYNRTLSDEEVFRLYQTAVPQGIDTGLVGYWPFDGDDISGTTASDRSGKGNHGTITSGTTKTLGKAGQALDFSAGNGGVQVNSLTQTGQTYTFATWAKVTSCINEYIFDTVAGRLVLACGNRVISYYDGTWKSVGSANSIPLNEWVHLVWVLNSSSGTATGYINGVSVGTNSYVGQNIGTTTRIGSYYEGGAAIVQGALDDFRVYNRALTAADVQDLYQKTQSDTVGASNKRDSLALGLAGYWKLDDASGTTATDSSTNGNNGTLTNGPTWGTGQIQGAANFDGTDDYVNIPDAPIYTPSALSVSFWKKDIDANYGRTFVSKTATGNRSWRVFGSDADRGVQFIISDALNTETNIGTTPNGIMAVGQWYHVTAVFNGAGSGNAGRMQIYINGVVQPLTFAGMIPATMVDNTTALNISGWQNGSGVFYGDMDEVRIYNRPLSAEEADRLYRTTAPTGVDTGLKGYWSFDGDDISGTTATDLSGASNHGTLTNGPTKTIGKSGQALSFDGLSPTGSIATLGDSASLRLTGNMTLSAWVYPTRLAGAGNGETTQAIIAKSGVGGNRGYMLTTKSDGTFVFNIASDVNTLVTRSTSTSIWSINNWYFVTGVYNASAQTMDVYVNGVLSNGTLTGTIPASQFSNNGVAVDIGGRSVYPDSNFKGSLDEPRIYNRALSVDEVREEYDYGKADKINTAGSDPLTDGLAGYWKLDDASGTTATDSSGNGNNGTLTNGPTWTAGQVQGAASFDGVNDYITANRATNSNVFTYAAWVRWTSGTDGTVIGTTFGGTQFRIINSSGLGSLNLLAAGVVNIGSSVNKIAGGIWNHVVVTNDAAGNYKFYINGADAGGSGNHVYSYAASPGIAIGARYYDSGSENFTGLIDETRVYNRVLTADEISQLYRTTVPTGVDTSLVGYWPFDGDDFSGTTTYDRSGKGNNGTLTNGPTKTIGKIGQALSFDGTDDFVITSHLAALNAYPITVSTWVKTGVNDATRRYILNKYNFPNGYVINLLSGKIRTWYLTGNSVTDYVYDGSEGMSSKAVVSDNQWHLVTFTVDAAGGKLYIDGTLEDSMAWTGTPQATSNTEGIRWSAVVTGGDKIAASLDETRIYNRALTASEIQNLYRKGR